MRCPLCKAENAEGSACRRCKADLSLLRAAEARRRALLARACRQLLESIRQRPTEDAEVSTRDDVVRTAAAAERLRFGADAHSLIAMARLLARDFVGAFRAYRRAKSE